jgi:hypothetical protein
LEVLNEHGGNQAFSVCDMNSKPPFVDLDSIVRLESLLANLAKGGTGR